MIRLGDDLSAAVIAARQGGHSIEGSVIVAGATAELAGHEGTAIRAFVEGEGGGARLKAMLFRVRRRVDRGAALQERMLHLPGLLRAEEWCDTSGRKA